MKRFGLLAVPALSLFFTAHADERFPGKSWLIYASPEEAGFSSEDLAEAYMNAGGSDN